MGTRASLRSLHTIWPGALLLAFLFQAPEVEGQALPLDPVDETGIALQWEKPFIPDSEGLAALSSMLEADVIFPVGSRKSLQIGVPLAMARADALDGTSLYLGNLRFSLLFGDPADLRGVVGLTVPTASNISGPDLAVIVGVLPYLDELEKWSDDVVSLRGAWIPSRPLDRGGRLGLRLGGAALVPTDYDNLFVYARVGGWGRFPVGDGAELLADLGTSYAVNDDDGFGEQFTAYLTLGAALSDVSGHPGLFVRVPLDGDARSVLDFSIGLRAQF